MPELNEGEEAIASRAASGWAASARACQGGLLRSRSLGDLAGFEHPLLTLVREGDMPCAGAELSVSVDAESVLVFLAQMPHAR